MKQLMMLFFLTICLRFSMAQETTYVHFDFNSDQLAKSESDKLENVLMRYKVEKLDSIVLRGHTDNYGSNAYNLQLSLRRVNSIGEKFKDYAIVKKRVYGEVLPLKDNSDEFGRALNRRVEIVWYLHSSESVTKSVEPVAENMEQKKMDSIIIAERDKVKLETVIAGMRAEVEQKHFNPSDGQVIKSKNGTLLLIQDNSFVDAEGATPKQVDLKLKEYYDLNLLIADKLTATTTDGRLLETGGMMNISATNEEGKELFLKKTMTVIFPGNENRKSDMQLYEGVEVNGEVKWKLAETPDYIPPKKLDKNQLAMEALDSIATLDNQIGRQAQMIKKGLALGQAIKKHGKLSVEDLKLILKASAQGQEIKSIEALERENYLLTTTKMGYVNCDRSALANIQGQRITVKLSEKTVTADTKSYLIFDSVNSYTNPDEGSKGAMFNGIPEKMPITILSFRVVNSEFQVAVNKVLASTNVIKQTFSAKSEDEFKTLVQSLMKL